MSEDHFRLAFVADTEVIVVGHHLDHYFVAVSWVNWGQKEYMNESRVVMGLGEDVKIVLDVVVAAA